MLPTTGHFKTFMCPFYDACICERPYCHFKHSKKETADDKHLISELVSKAVHKVLQSNPNAQSSTDDISKNSVEIPKNLTYNPTPIAELNRIKNRGSSNTSKSTDDLNSISGQYSPEQLISEQTEKKAKDDTTTDVTISYVPSIIKTLSTDLNDIPSEQSLKHYVPSNKSSNGISMNSSDSVIKSFYEKELDFDFFSNYNYSSLDNISSDSKEIKTINIETYSEEKGVTKQSVKCSSSEKLKKQEDRKKHSSAKSDNIKKHDNDKKKHNNQKHDDGKKHSESKKHSDDKKHDDGKKHSDHTSRKKSKHKHEKESKHSKRHKHSRHKKSTEKDKRRSSSSSSYNKNKSSELKETKIEDDDIDVDIFLTDSDESTTEECKRIFEEYKPATIESSSNTFSSLKIEDTEGDSQNIVMSKRRIAHENSVNIIKPPVVKPIQHKSLDMILLNRYKQTSSNSTGTLPNQPSISNNKNPATSNLTGKNVRIAHVPNVSSLLSAKKEVQEKVKQIKTPVQTITKGYKRVAHKTETLVTDIPTLIEEENTKLPINIRYIYLSLLLKECLGLYISKTAAFERATNEEFNCFKKCNTVNTYKNSTMLAISRLRKEANVNDLPVNSSTESAAVLPNESIFTGEAFYQNIKKWILTDNQLYNNGFPRPSTLKKGQAIFNTDVKESKLPNDFRKCCRCKKIYSVDLEGFQITKEECLYHPKGYSVRDNMYFCCSSSSPVGCALGAQHVFEYTSLNKLSGFVSTLPPSDETDTRSHEVYAMDCEMLYTTKGFELGRVTVVDCDCKVVFECLVKPYGHILDYNTRFSGLTEELMKSSVSRLTDVQAALLSRFNSKTILVGHSLESDLKALRIIHETVIDTSILFPHRLGPPKKRALRNLASDYLRKIIQNSDSGHDSSEDAITCMELLKYKLKQELK